MTAVDASQGGVGAPATNGFVIVNDVEFPFITRAIYVGGSGIAVIQMMGKNPDGSPIILTFSGLVAGSTLPVRAVKVIGQGTSVGAGLLIGLY